MKTLSFLLTLVSLHVAVSQWVDPHSMDTRHKTKLPQPSVDPTRITTAPKECTSDLHLRRIVRIILNNAHLDTDVDYHEGYINIKLSSIEHQLLVNFSQSTEKEETVFKQVSTIFEKAFQKPTAERYGEMVLSLQEKLYHVVFNPTSTALVSACVSLFVTYRLVKAQFNWKSIVKFFLILAYITDFLVTYFNIAREEEIDNMVNIKKLGTAPPECDPQKMSWWSFIKTQFDSNPCRTYYLATYPNSLYIIAPSRVFTRQFRTLIVEPCGDIGEAFGKFGRGMFTNLPWGLNVVIFPLMLVTTCALVFIVFLFITKPHFKVSLFHLFTVELGENRTQALPRNEPERQIEWRPHNRRRRNRGREVGQGENERAYVEEVSYSRNESQKKGGSPGTKALSKDKKVAETGNEVALSDVTDPGDFLGGLNESFKSV